MAAASRKYPLDILVFLCLIFTRAEVQGQVLYDYTGSIQLQTSYPPTRVLVPAGEVFPFFGKFYDAFYVSKDGIVGFSQYAHHAVHRVYSRENKRLNAREDFPFVAPFLYGGAELGSPLAKNTIYSGKIYYKVLKQPASQLANISSFINDAVIGVSGFKANYGLLVTWYNVTDVNELNKNCKDDNCKKNIFQGALVTDGTYSFAIFNYQKTDITTIPSYQAGFNAGNGRGWREAMSSASLQNAASTQGSNVTGRFIYMINQERIITGGCNGQRNVMGTLQVTPSFAGMLGGEMIEVSGPCLSDTDIVTLRFGDTNFILSDSCTVVNSMKARCEVPMLTQIGQVTVALSQDNVHFYYQTKITIVHPSRMPSSSKVVLPDNGPTARWNETSAITLTVTWDPKLLSTQPRALVDVIFVGYTEDPAQYKAGWTLRRNLNTQNVFNSAGKFSFNPDNIPCDSECMAVETGVVSVRLRNKTQAWQRRGIYSRVIPVGWFVNTQMTAKYGSNWPHAKCLAWYNQDRKDMAWLNNLEYCPCTLQQALVDFGRWQTDMGCNLYSTDTGKCRYHQGAVHCVRAVQPTATIGAGNQCCYGHDSLLIYAADTFQGSTPDRSHDWGAAPYVRPGHVPSLSHWIKDVVTFYYCCLWTDYGDCNYYMDQRATRDCTGYSPPKQAMVYGQGNIKTFDGATYFVCGEHDFILLNSSDVVIQGRFLKSPFNAQNNHSVILTDVGIKIRQEVIEIRLKGPDVDRSKRTLDVIVNGEFQYFDKGPLRWKDFTESAVVNSADPANTKESNLTVILKNGVGVQVAETNKMLSLIVMIPPMYNSSGLLGSWDSNVSNEFTSLYNGQSISQKAAVFYENFTMSWAVKSSIIPFPVSKIVSNICTNQAIPNNRPNCQNDAPCNRDWFITNNNTLAMRSLRFSQRYTELQEDVTPVRSCGLLNVPRSTKDNYNYSLGNTVTIIACRSGTLKGATRYTCTDVQGNSQKWTPSVSAKCQVNGVEGANVALIVGILVPIVIILLIIIVVIVCLKRKKSKKSTPPKTTSSENSGEVRRSVDNQAYHYDPRYSDVKPTDPKQKTRSRSEQV